MSYLASMLVTSETNDWPHEFAGGRCGFEEGDLKG